MYLQRMLTRNFEVIQMMVRLAQRDNITYQSQTCQDFGLGIFWSEHKIGSYSMHCINCLDR